MFARGLLHVTSSLKWLVTCHGTNTGTDKLQQLSFSLVGGKKIKNKIFFPALNEGKNKIKHISLDLSTFLQKISVLSLHVGGKNKKNPELPVFFSSTIISSHWRTSSNKEYTECCLGETKNNRKSMRNGLKHIRFHRNLQIPHNGFPASIFVFTFAKWLFFCFKDIFSYTWKIKKLIDR